MAIREQIDVDLKAAMIAKDTVKTSVLRMIKSAAKNKEIDVPGHKALDDAEMISLLSTLKKQRDESISQFKTGGRQDLADKEQAEIDVIMTYLPKQLDDAELDTLVTAAIATAGAAGPKDMGKVMKLVQEQTKGRADGKLVSEKVKAKLAAMGG
jgi:uncharacterized protein YqeY